MLLSQFFGNCGVLEKLLRTRLVAGVNPKIFLGCWECFPWLGSRPGLEASLREWLSADFGINPWRESGGWEREREEPEIPAGIDGDGMEDGMR